MDATRVHLGFIQLASVSLFYVTPLASSAMAGSHTLVRMTSGRLVSLFTPSVTNTLERQQESSLANMQVQGATVGEGPCDSTAHVHKYDDFGRDSILKSGFTFAPIAVF